MLSRKEVIRTATGWIIEKLTIELFTYQPGRSIYLPDEDLTISILDLKSGKKALITKTKTFKKEKLARIITVHMVGNGENVE